MNPLQPDACANKKIRDQLKVTVNIFSNENSFVARDQELYLNG